MAPRDHVPMDEVEFRIKVLTGLDVMGREVKLLRESTTTQITEIFSRVNTIEVKGCAHAPDHESMDKRLRNVEQEIAIFESKPKPTSFNGNGKKRLSLGKYIKWEGFSATDIILILAVVIFGVIAVSKHTDMKKLIHLEKVVTELQGAR